MSTFDEPKIKFNIDLDEIEAINQKRTLAFINHWVYHTILFLNQFSVICQQKLSTLDNKLSRANDLLSTLESKLSSIPGLEDVTEDVKIVTIVAEEYSEPVHSPSSKDEDQVETRETPTDKKDNEIEKKPEEMEEGSSMIPISSHPHFAPYFKMVNFGVPKEAVKLKMTSCGIDSALLDDPMLQVEYKAGTNNALSTKSSDSDA